MKLRTCIVQRFKLKSIRGNMSKTKSSSPFKQAEKLIIYAVDKLCSKVNFVDLSEDKGNKDKVSYTINNSGNINWKIIKNDSHDG